MERKLPGLSAQRLELLAHLLKEEGVELPLPPRLPKRPEADALPLSFAQQRLWFLDQLQPNSCAYNIPFSVRITGPLNVRAFEQSLNAIVQRHETLRTRFVARQGRPWQVIAPTLTLALPVRDLRYVSDSDRQAEADRLATEEAQRPFDLAQGPLMRAMLLWLDEHAYVLVVNMHHIISDGWSWSVFWRELSQGYAAIVLGKSPPLPPLPMQYADYAIWQRDWLQGEVLESQLSYWEQQLGRNPTALHMPLDHPRPPVQSYRGARQLALLPVSLSAALQALSRHEGVTLFTTLLAALQTLLYRYTGQDDIIVGSAIAGRSRVETEGMIGFFVNMLPMRTDMAGEPTFRNLLRRARQVVLGAFAHQDLPFERLVEELQTVRELSRNPIFQVSFTLQNTPQATLQLPGLTTSAPMAIETAATPFDLGLSVSETDDGLRCQLYYNPDLFEDATVSRMLGHFHTLLRGIVADPEQRITELPVLTAAETHQLLAEGHPRRTDDLEDSCVHHLVEAQVKQAPDALAATFVAPRTATERRLAHIWAAVLGLERVSVTDDFFALGGHSLKATQILGRIVDVFGVELSHQSIFETLTVSELAVHIDRLRSRGWSVRKPVFERLDSGASAPLSWGQEEIWLTAQYVPDVPVYNEPFSVDMRGPIKTTPLEKAMRALVQRHAILRTGFVMGHGEPRQAVHEEAAFRLTVADLGLLTPAERESRALHLATAQARRPFDLAQPPLMRATLVRMHETDCRLYLVFHHLVIDAFAVYNVFMPELWQCYTAFEAGQSAPQLQPPIPYSAYTRWQRQASTAGPLQNNLAYWRRQLDGAQPLDLPTDRQRPAVRTFRGAMQRLAIAKGLSLSLHALSRRQGVTLFMTLLAAFKTILWRYTQANDVVVGTVEAGRSRPEFEHVLGYFLNTLVLRTTMAGNLTFVQLLQRVRDVVLEAHTHRDMPLLKLIEALQPPRNRARHPLFQVAFVMEPTMSESAAGWVVSQLDVQTGTAKFDLTVELEERAEGIIGRFEYSRDLFDDATITTMIGHFQALLERIVAHPSAPIATIPMLTETEKRQLFQRRPRVAPRAAHKSCLHERFEAQVEQTPHKVAVSLDDRSLTYRELNRRANQLAQRLRQLGVGPEVMVALCVERSLSIMIGILGILKAGGAYVPFDPESPRERLALLLEDVQAAVLVTQPHLLEKIPLTPAHVVCLENEPQGHGDTSDENLVSDVRPDNLAYVMYTSGSTGKPKGVMVTHHNVSRLFAATEWWFRFGPSDVWTLFHAYTFDFSVWEMWGALLYGGRLVVVPHWLSRSPREFYHLLCTEHVTVLNQTPSTFRQLMHEDAHLGMQDSSLRHIIFGGEALELRSLKPWFERHGDKSPQLTNMYGITETTVHVTGRPLSLADTDLSGSVIGQPMPDLQCYILDRHLQPVPAGVHGEIYIGGEGVARGYLHHPEWTAERFVCHPFSTQAGDRLYKTGDLGRYVTNGDIEYLGRTDHQIKLRGFRIELGEIEAALTGHASVKDAVVIAREDTPDTKRLVAYVVPDRNPPPGSAALRRFLHQKLPDYMVPSAFVVLPALPLTPNGKLDRKALPEPDVQRSRLQGTPRRPRTPVESTLIDIWCEVLHLERINLQDNFFELGGHSLLATQVISRVRDAFQVSIPFRALFDSPTVADLAVIVNHNLVQESHGPEIRSMLDELDEMST